MAFNDVSKAVKEQLAEVMKDQNISDEVLGKLTGVLNNLTELDKQHQEVVDKCLDYRDKYVQGITNFGTKDKPQEEKKGRTFEEITAEVLAKSK